MLSDLAHARSTEQSGEDLTAQHDRTAARLADARTRRRALDRRTAYATVAVTVTAARHSAATERSSDSRFTPAAASPPPALRRRRREAALNAA